MNPLNGAKMAQNMAYMIMGFLPNIFVQITWLGYTFQRRQVKMSLRDHFLALTRLTSKLMGFLPSQM